MVVILHRQGLGIHGDGDGGGVADVRSVADGVREIVEPGEAGIGSIGEGAVGIVGRERSIEWPREHAVGEGNGIDVEVVDRRMRWRTGGGDDQVRIERGVVGEVVLRDRVGGHHGAHL